MLSRNVVYLSLYHGATAPGEPRPLICRGFQIEFRRTTIGRTSLDGRPLLDNTQHSQLTIIHATDGVRTHNPSKFAAADSCGHRVRLFIPWAPINLINWLGQLITNGKQHLSTFNICRGCHFNVPNQQQSICLYRLSCRPTHSI